MLYPLPAVLPHLLLYFFFFFNDTATTEIYTLSLHDALPIPRRWTKRSRPRASPFPPGPRQDRKSTRLNSSHTLISYAVFCLKKKKINRSEAVSKYLGINNNTTQNCAISICLR